MTINELRESTGNDMGYYYGYLIVGAAFLIMTVFWGAYYSFGVFFKPMVNEFGWTAAMTSGAFSLSSITNGLLAIAMGGLTDKFGPRVVMTMCGSALGLGYILMSQITAGWHLYLVFGIIVGIGMSGSFVPLMSTVARSFIAKRGIMTGIVTAGIGMGAFFGPPIASRLIFSYGWRLSFSILGCTILIVAILFSQFFKYGPTPEKMSYSGNAGEQDISKPLVDSLSLKEAIYTFQFWVVASSFFCFGFVLFGIMVHMIPHSSEVGMSAAGAANTLAIIGGASIVGKVLIGRVADSIGSRNTYMIGFILMTAALACIVPSKTALLLYTFSGFFGFAYGACVVSQSPLVAFLFGLGSHGLILGVLSFTFLIGGSLGPLLIGYLFDITGNYRLAFSICAVASFVSLLLTAFLKQKKASS
ncbi:MAG: MFS transporter [Pseudomonadota bacterium]